MSARPPSSRRAALGYARPETYEALRAVLASGTLDFPKRLRQVAIFLWQRPGEVAVGTIGQVAAQAGVQPSTLVRFAQIFGFAGFSELQALFKAHVTGAWTEPGDGAAGAEPDPGLAFLAGLVAAAQASLARLRDGIDPAAFERAAARLAAAEVIHVLGSKRAFPVASYAALALAQQGMRATLVDNLGSIAFDQMGCLGPGDAVLAISFSPYNSATPELAALARDRGAGVVAITDSALSPLAGLAEAWVEVVETDHAGFRPLAAPLALGLALVQAAAAARRAAAAGMTTGSD